MRGPDPNHVRTQPNLPLEIRFRYSGAQILQSLILILDLNRDGSLGAGKHANGMPWYVVTPCGSLKQMLLEHLFWMRYRAPVISKPTTRLLK